MEPKNVFTDARIVQENCSNEAYLNFTGEPRGNPGHVLSRTSMSEFVVCPDRWRRGVPEKSTSALEFGSLVDCLTLQRDQFDSRFVVRPSTYPDSKTGEPKPWTLAANFCKDWVAKNAGGRTVVSPDDFEAAELAIDRLEEDPSVRGLLETCKTQVMVVANYNDRETGLKVPVKGLIDIVPSKDDPIFGSCLGDLKTARSAAPGKWSRVVWEHGYMVQGALYVALYNAATGEDRNTFVHLIVENEPPYEPGRRVLSQEFIEIGHMCYRTALREYCRCLSTGNWPGYDSENRALPTMPGWSLTQPEPWMVSRLDTPIYG